MQLALAVVIKGEHERQKLVVLMSFAGLANIAALGRWTSHIEIVHGFLSGRGNVFAWARSARVGFLVGDELVDVGDGLRKQCSGLPVGH